VRLAIKVLLLGAASGVLGLLCAAVVLWFAAGPIVAGLKAAHYGCSFTTGGDAVVGGEWVCTNNMVYVLPVGAAGLVVAFLTGACLFVPLLTRLVRREASAREHRALKAAHEDISGGS